MDLLIKNVTIVDGTGREGYLGSIGIHKGKITVNPTAHTAERIIDGTGKTACPGFIDAHSHGDLTCGRDFQNLCKTSQGITTEMAGNCGITLAPISPGRIDLILRSGEYGELPDMPNWTTFENYMKYLDGRAKSLNTALYVGHSTIRTAVMGFEERLSTPEELRQMQGYLEEAMKAGAAGMSTGLPYIPGTFADTEELIALAKVLKAYDGTFASHMRNESFDVVRSVEEVIRIAREADVKLFISHHKVLGRSNWGLQKQTLRLIQDAVSEGVRITCDQYPYTRNMTGVRTCIPPEYFTVDLEHTAASLKNDEIRREIRKKMEDADSEYDNYYLNAGGWGGITICTSPNVPLAVGKTVLEYAKAIGREPFEAYFDLMVSNKCLGYAVFDSMCEDDVLEIAAFDHTVVGTDGDLFSSDAVTHPRAFATFPRAICYYVKEKKLFTLEQMIHRMTYKTAERCGIPNKGAILDGYDGDIVVFDYENLRDMATYLESNALTEGIEQVIVDGVVVYENKQLTGRYPGKVIRKNSRQAVYSGGEE